MEPARELGVSQMHVSRRWLSAAAGLLSLALVGVFPVAHADDPEATCASAEHPGGDWPGLNNDLTNSRYQAAEDVIGPDNAGSLSAKWAVTHPDPGAGGTQSTATVGGGCVYVGTTTGWVYALNADSGDLVWTAPAGGQQSGFVMAVTYADGRVHASVSNPSNLRAFALDAATGERLWMSDHLANHAERHGDFEAGSPPSSIYSSPVVFDGMVFVTIGEGQGRGWRIPYFFFDAADGTLIHKSYPITVEEAEQGFSGTGIWGTAAVDADERYLYAGTADPEGYGKFHPYNAAILKIDVDRERPTFGQVVGAYKGVEDTYVPGTDRQPLCRDLAEDTQWIFDESSAACAEIDASDFGASPNLYVDEHGHKVVTAMQKLGVLHGVWTQTMTEKWRSVVSHPTFLGNASTAAAGEGGLFVSANPGTVYGMNSTAWIQWASNTAADAVRYQPMTLANGVVYTLDATGTLHAWDADTGVPLLRRPVSLDTGDTCAVLSGGVSVARNTVFVNCDIGLEGGWVVAYTVNA